MKQDGHSLVGKRIALTGATGFIGKSLLPKLILEGAHVIALTRSPDRSGLPQHNQVSWVNWNLERPEVTRSALRHVDSICHLAAYIPEKLDDVTEAEVCIRHNGLGTLGLLQAAKEHKISFLLNLSAGQFYPPNTKPASELDPVYPSTRAVYYLTSKLIAEIFVDYHGRHRGLDTVNLRVGSPYGIGMSPKSTVASFIRQALSNQPLQLAADGRYSVDLVYVEDVTRVIVSALKNRATGTFNVGSGRATTMVSLAQQVLRLAGASSELIEFVPGPPDPGFPPLDLEKIRLAFDYSPTPLSKGLSKMIAACRTRTRMNSLT
jgi:nucleoside-diphosphate-sugar epimerase